MNRNLVFSDYVVFVVYFIIVASYGIWIYRRKKKAVTDTHDFFLAEGSLTWWAIGASLIASNPVLPTLCGEYANAASRRACTYPHSAYTMRIDRPLLTERMTYACPVHATGTRDGGCSLRSTT